MLKNSVGITRDYTRQNLIWNEMTRIMFKYMHAMYGTITVKLRSDLPWECLVPSHRNSVLYQYYCYVYTMCYMIKIWKFENTNVLLR